MTTEILAPPTAAEQLHDPEELRRNVTDRIYRLIDPSDRLQNRFRTLVGLDETPLRPAWLHIPTGYREIKDEESGEVIKTVPRQNDGYAVNVMLKDETVHECGAYKVRGGASAVADLDKDPVTASAGNHGNGTNYAVLRSNALLGTHFTTHVHASETASPVKINSLIANKAKVYQEGNRNLADATKGAERQVASDPDRYELVSAYDNIRVMAGQGTLLHESLLQLQESGFDLLHDEVEVVVPLGGGGMAAGCASWLHEMQQAGYVGRGVRLVAVQVEDKENCSFVDGTYTQTGEKTAAIIADMVQQGVLKLETVQTAEVASAMQVLKRTLGKEVEPAGALATAYVLRDAQRQRNTDEPDKRYVSVVSGANASAETLAEARRLAGPHPMSKLCGKFALSGFAQYSRLAAAPQIITPKSQR